MGNPRKGLKIILGLTGMLKAVWNNGYPRLDQFFAAIMAMDTIISFGFILLNPRILEGTSPVKAEFPPLFGESTEEPIQEELTGIKETEQTPAKDEFITDEGHTKKFQFIESYFQTQKPFLKEEFSRETLALDTGLNKKTISEEIKTATGMNFSDYVNSYRIRYLEENATLRPEWKKYTVDALAAEIGFFNRGSFYNAVKRHRNMTPGQLLKNLELGDRD